MAEWGNTFNLGDVYQTSMLYRALQNREQENEFERQQKLEKQRIEAEDRLRESATRRVAVQKMMANDMYKRAMSEGLTGDALKGRVMELFPAYQQVYKTIGGDWQDATPDAILSLATPDESELDARKQALIENAKYRVRSAYGDTPLDQEAIRMREEQRNPKETPEEKLQRELRLKDYESELRIKEKGTPSWSDAHPQFNKPPTYEQGRAASFINRMQEAAKVIETLEQSGYTPDRKFGLASNIGGINEVLGGSRYGALSEQGQQWAQAEDQWINALLRSDTGAAYKDMEVSDLKAQFFPRAGDDEKVRAQKRNARLSLMTGMEPMAGSVYVGQGQVGRLPPGFREGPDGYIYGPDGRKYRRAQ